MEIIIALDIGKTRTGIAKSDVLGLIIKPLKTIETLNLIEEIKKLKEQFIINQIVVGQPKNIGNQETGQFVKEQASQILLHFPEVKLLFIDESFTSREAEAVIKERGIRITKDNKSLIDMYAAAIILEDFFKLGENN